MGALSLRDLTFRYPGANDAALQGLTLDIPRGGVFGLLGPNGAGKTTLISLIAGQLRGASGEMLLDGAPLAEARRRAPRSLGLVPQEHAFYPMLTCRENLRFFGGVQGLGAVRLAERVAAASAFARLEPVLERRAGELSGGLKRRLNFAIGLLTEPQVLLLDEPTVGVDAQSARSPRPIASSSTPATTWRRCRRSATAWRSSTMGACCSQARSQKCCRTPPARSRCA